MKNEQNTTNRVTFTQTVSGKGGGGGGGGVGGLYSVNQLSSPHIHYKAQRRNTMPQALTKITFPWHCGYALIYIFVNIYISIIGNEKQHYTSPTAHPRQSILNDIYHRKARMAVPWSIIALNTPPEQLYHRSHNLDMIRNLLIFKNKSVICLQLS